MRREAMRVRLRQLEDWCTMVTWREAILLSSSGGRIGQRTLFVTVRRVASMEKGRERERGRVGDEEM